MPCCGQRDRHQVVGESPEKILPDNGQGFPGQPDSLRQLSKITVHKNQVRSLQNMLEAKKEEVQLTKVQSDRLELELRSRDEAIAKLRASLNVAKTNKEYAAVLTQLNTSKADNSKIETQVFELMKGIEIAGAASYLMEASRSGCTLFI